MSDADSEGNGDRYLRLAGIALVLGIVVGVSIVAMAIASGPAVESSLDASWSYERVNDSHAQIVHQGGEPVEGDNLVVTVDSYERQVDTPDVVVEGDAISFEARSGQVVRLYWTPSEERSTLLESWRPDID